jgi:hypothetical protein
MFKQHIKMYDNIKNNVLANVTDTILANYGDKICDELVQKHPIGNSFRQFSLVVRKIINRTEINKLIDFEIKYQFQKGMFNYRKYLREAGEPEKYLTNTEALKLAINLVKTDMRTDSDYHGNTGGSNYIISMIEGFIDSALLEKRRDCHYSLSKQLKK